MSYEMSLPEITPPQQRLYTDLKGVDFSSIPSRVATYRSPDAKNVYKNYLSEAGQAIETRPGVNLLGTITNEIDNKLLNWDFSEGSDNWITSNIDNFQVNDGIASGTATSQYAYIKNYVNDGTGYKGHKIYGYIKAKATSSIVYLNLYDGITSELYYHSGSGDYERLSAIKVIDENATRLEIRLQDGRTSGWDTIYFDEAILVDLTARFGAGNEPSLDEMDDWIDAIMSTTANKIYGIHILGSKALVHCEKNLYIWDTFPGTIESIDDLTDTPFIMNPSFSSSFVHNGILYILDGKNYLMFDGSNINEVAGYVPTTSIDASPDGSNRTVFQCVNYISDYRINTFCADGTDAYHLDATNIDDESFVTVKVYNDSTKQWDTKTLTTHYTVNTTDGVVTFTDGNEPEEPAASGTVNVEITYKKHIGGYAEHILGCTLAKVFDNRVFLSGNSSHKGKLFHSELDNPAYFSDENWYNDGSDNISIKSIVSASDKLVCIKDDTAQGVKVFYHTSSYDSVFGSIYPINETEIYLGACAEGINFRDTIVYLSKQGLESVYSPSELLHKSSLVDTKLINEPNLENAKLKIWNNYLCVLINGKIYLADSRQQTESYEYEWYYWDNAGIDFEGALSKAILLKEYEGNLYLATEGGHICNFQGTHDDSIVNGETVPKLIENYWTTPMDVFNSLTHLKTTNKRGGVVQIKRIPNSIFKIDVMTDKEAWHNILSSPTPGFDFCDLDFSNFSFGTGVRGMLVFKIKKRKIKQFSIKFYSNIIDKPMGIYEATIEFSLGNYIKN